MAVVYGIRCFLCSRVALRHLSVGAHLATRCLSQCLGGKNSLRSNIMPPVSKHCSAARCTSQRCPLDKLLMLAAKAQTSLAFARLHVTFRPWRGITFCNKNSLVCITDFNAHYANILKPAPSNVAVKRAQFELAQ